MPLNIMNQCIGGEVQQTSEKITHLICRLMALRLSFLMVVDIFCFS